MDHRWIATRQAALARLEDFSKVAPKYARSRNEDRGRGRHEAVSRLSPYLRYRMLTEAEVIAHLCRTHEPASIMSFVREVAWRSYWKGWLQMRPAVWSQYQQRCHELLAGQIQGYDRVTRGQTGIRCFDDWTHELIETGYLHNHARMWWASIFIFTLELPWELGAYFFQEHLIDADPASNLLSWRWVAGRFTPGKLYLASASNIERWTLGRYADTPGLCAQATAPRYEMPPPQLALDATRLGDEQAGPTPPEPATQRVGLWVGDHDLHPESLFEQDEFSAVALVGLDLGPDRPKTRFLAAAREDAHARLVSWRGGEAVSRLRTSSDIARWASEHQLDAVVTAQIPVAQAQCLGLGPSSGPLARMRMRTYDQLAWPHATRGFFRFFKKAGAALIAHSRDMFP